MLQIVSRKFFGDGERYEFEGKDIVYSNMSWVGSIETRVGVVEPVDTTRLGDLLGGRLVVVNRAEGQRLA